MHVKGKFQNWISFPKTTYRSIDFLNVGLYDAVICTKEDYSGRIRGFDQLSLYSRI